MCAAYVITTVVTIVANAWAAGADLAQPKWVLANMDEVGVPRSWLLPLAVLKGAGAAGLLLGLLGVRPLGITAAIGLVLFFTGALAAHVRARVFHNIAFPGAYFALASASAACLLRAGQRICGARSRRPLTAARLRRNTTAPTQNRDAQPPSPAVGGIGGRTRARLWGSW